MSDLRSQKDGKRPWASIVVRFDRRDGSSATPVGEGRLDARHDQPSNAFTHSVQFLRRARRDVEELGLADKMHHGYRRIDATGDAVKLELFVEVAGLSKAPHNMRRADLAGIRYQALIGVLANL